MFWEILKWGLAFNITGLAWAILTIWCIEKFVNDD